MNDGFTIICCDCLVEQDFFLKGRDWGFLSLSLSLPLPPFFFSLFYSVIKRGEEKTREREREREREIQGGGKKASHFQIN